VGQTTIKKTLQKAENEIVSEKGSGPQMFGVGRDGRKENAWGHKEKKTQKKFRGGRGGKETGHTLRVAQTKWIIKNLPHHPTLRTNEGGTNRWTPKRGLEGRRIMGRNIKGVFGRTRVLEQRGDLFEEKAVTANSGPKQKNPNIFHSRFHLGLGKKGNATRKKNRAF